MEAQNNKQVSTSFSNGYSNRYTHLNQLKYAMQTQGTLIQEAQKRYVKSNKAMEAYMQSIQETPTYACCICDRLSFGKDM